MIGCFGTRRCMFRSDIPVDRISISYPVLWRGLKKIAIGYSEEKKSHSLPVRPAGSKRLFVAHRIHRLGSLEHHQAHGFDLDSHAREGFHVPAQIKELFAERLGADALHDHQVQRLFCLPITRSLI